MSGAQIGTVVGQVVGGYFFGPVGAGIGGAIGGAIGGTFDPDIINQGPRLTDLKIQSSTYGNAVPIVYGTVRVAGNVIWASDIRETALETDQGKGGPTVTQVTFSYDMDAAISLGEGELTGISRIYANGLLIYDVAFGSSPQNIYASGQWASSIIFYPGSETQLPDPTIEAAVGLGNCQAYRGTSYVVFNSLQLNVLKVGTLPNFEFVVSQNAAVQQYLRKTVATVSPAYNRVLPSSSAGYPRVVMDANLIRVTNSGYDILARVYDLDGNLVSTEDRTDFEVGLPQLFDGISTFGAWTMDDKDQTDLLWTNTALAATGATLGAISLSALLPAGRRMVAFSVGVDRIHVFVMHQDATMPVSTLADQWTMFEWDGTDANLESTGTVDVPTVNYFEELGAPTAFLHYHASMMESDNKTIWSAYGAGTYTMDLLQIDGSGVLRRLYQFNSAGNPNSPDGTEPGGQFTNLSIYADAGIAAVVTGDKLLVFTRMAELDPGSQTLEYIVHDLCIRAGIADADLDCTDLDAEVKGFVIGQSMTARSAIEPLRTGYYFDAVDGDKLKFIERGGAVSAVFEFEDLGAGQDKGRDIVIEASRAQETELPSRVNVKYISKAADYQQGAQSARRETTQSRETLDLPLPIVFEDDRAAQVADTVMRQLWAGRTARSWSTGTDYARNEPTDVATVDDSKVVRQLRITDRADRGSLIEWKGVDEDVAAYTSNAIGTPIVVPLQSLQINSASPTAFQVLDLPPLTELPDGNESAVYVAAKGYSASWGGARFDISRTAGATYVAGTVINTASVMGTAMTALGNFLGGNIFDNSNTVRVNVGTGTLSSATTAEVLNGSNGIVIDDEILQYKTATVVSTGVYDLSGFLRGRKGTEYAISTHAIGDRFVLLTTNLRNLPLLVSDRTAGDLLVRATTSGMLVSQGSVKTFDPQIARLMPYSPVRLGAIKDGSGNWDLDWTRRDRYMNDWNSGVDVPMSEDSELYDVEVESGGSVVASYANITSPAQIVPYTVLGSGATSITFSVWQKSAVVGRGFEATATITT